MSNISEMKQLACTLSEVGHTVSIPEESDTNWEALSEPEHIKVKKRFIDNHLSSIAKSDTILIANYPKNGESGYIGTNVIMEISFGYNLGKPVILLFEPSMKSNRLEVLSVATRVLNGVLDGKLLQEGH